MSEMRDVLAEYSEYITFSNWLKNIKGVDLPPEKCYELVQKYTKYSEYYHEPEGMNPTQTAIFNAAVNRATHFIGATSQIDELYELDYALRCGVNPVKDYK